MSWHDRYRPASFRGAGFYVDIGTRSGGRRGITFEYPKRDIPSDEDMGRRAKRMAVTGYVLGPDYDRAAQQLEDALNTEGPGALVLPNMDEMQVRCETYSRAESKDRGNIAVFEMAFVEVGTSAADLVSESTQLALQQQSDATTATVSSRGNERVAS